MLYRSLLKLAYLKPALRSRLVPLLRKYAWEKPSRWDEFLEERYEGGLKQIPNPNYKTRDKYPTVELRTAIEEDEETQEIIHLEYLDWLRDKTKAEEKYEALKKKPFGKPWQEKTEASKPFPKPVPQANWKYTKHPKSTDIRPALEHLNKVLKTKIERKDLPGLMGLPYAPWEEPPELRFELGHLSGGRPAVSVSSNSPPIDTMNRKFAVDKEGNPYIRNNVLMLDKMTRNGRKDAPKGWGGRIFINQVIQAAKAGFKYIQCEAEMNPPEWVGAQVWPKLGYDGIVPLPDQVEPRTSSRTGDPHTSPLPRDLEGRLKEKGFKKPYRMSHLWQVEGGAEWWEDNAITFDATFDLTEGSYSMRFLRDYVENKAKSLGISEQDFLSGPIGEKPRKTAAAKIAKADKLHEQIDTDAFDTEFSRNYWKQTR